MLRIGCGAGFAGDRLRPAVELIESDVDYLVLELLGERTVSLAQQRRKVGEKGYDPLFEDRINLLLQPAVERNTTIITNGGAADPKAAGKSVLKTADEFGLDVTVAILTGDDCTGLIKDSPEEHNLADEKIFSANAYLGAEELVSALENDNDGRPTVIVTGRLADPSLFVAPMIYEFGWGLDEWDLLGQGTLVGHLLECAGQITGGYFSDPRKKPVVDPHLLGFPFADVKSSGDAVIGKPTGTGGRIDRHTAREQLFYEVHDPSKYITPDVIADFSEAKIEEIGDDRVRVRGGTGKERPNELKCSVGVERGYRAVGYMAYGGPGSQERAQLAGEIVRDRVKEVHQPAQNNDIRIDIVGVNSLFGTAHSENEEDWAPKETEVRVVARTPSKQLARLVLREVYALYTNGPAGGGGFRPEKVENGITEVIGIKSTFLSRDQLTENVEFISTKNRHQATNTIIGGT